jgi:hypothetical protein
VLFNQARAQCNRDRALGGAHVVILQARQHI